MKKLIKFNLNAVVLFAVLAFFLSGCYTQLAKPKAQTEEVVYYDDEYEDYEGEEEYVEEDEDVDEVHIVRRFYHDYHYYGYPWWYDPFFDPYFYPYSSHVSIHIGFYDPFFYDPFFWYGPYFYYPGSVFVFGFGSSFGHFHHFHPFPHHGVFFTNVDFVTPKKRGFTRGRNTIEDDFGHNPRRTSVANSDENRSLNKSGLLSDESSSKSARRKRKDNSEGYSAVPVNSKYSETKRAEAQPKAISENQIRREKKSIKTNTYLKRKSKPVSKSNSKSIRTVKREPVSKSTKKVVNKSSYKKKRRVISSKGKVWGSSRKAVTTKKAHSPKRFIKYSSASRQKQHHSFVRSGSWASSPKSSFSKSSSRSSTQNRRSRR